MKWTKEKLQEEADKYETRGDFRKYSVAHIASSKKGLLNELFKNHPNQGYDENRIKNGYWTEERLQEEANKYKTRYEFNKKNKNTYYAASRKKIMDELFKNHPNQGYDENRIKNGYWTEERLQEEANKYNTRYEFQKENESAYNAGLNKKNIDKLFKKHPNKGYSYKEEWKENNYVVYAYELEEFNKVYVGLTNNIIRRDKEHLFSEKEKLSLFCRKNNLPLPKYKILEDNLISKTVRNREEYWYNFYKNTGWNMFNVAKTGGLGAAATKWTKKTLQKEADKYINRSEFQKEIGAAYNAALNKKIMDELFKNHPNQGYSNKQVKSGYWTIETLQKEADKYQNRSEFRIKNGSAHYAAHKKGIFDELFKNHSNQGYIGKTNGYWTKEKLQDEADKYLTRTEFSKKNSGAYCAASRKKIMEELFKNHKNRGYIYKKH